MSHTARWLLLVTLLLTGPAGCQYLTSTAQPRAAHAPRQGPATRLGERVDRVSDDVIEFVQRARGMGEPDSYERSYESSGYQW